MSFHLLHFTFIVYLPIIFFAVYLKRKIYNNNRNWKSKSGKNLGVWKSIVGDYHKKLELCEEKLRHSELKINQHETEIREMKDIVIRLEDEIGVFEIENIQLREIINNKNNC